MKPGLKFVFMFCEAVLFIFEKNMTKNKQTNKEIDNRK